MAAMNNAPSSGSIRNSPTRQPSSSHRCRKNTSGSGISPLFAANSLSTRFTAPRLARTITSSCAAVAALAKSINSASDPGVAIRVNARTFEYDSSPVLNASVTAGRSRNARATRTCSHAVAGATPHRHDAHCAADRHSHVSCPPRASYSPSSTNHRHNPASI